MAHRSAPLAAALLLVAWGCGSTRGAATGGDAAGPRGRTAAPATPPADPTATALAAPRVEAEAGDPAAVRTLVDLLQSMERDLDGGELERYAEAHWGAYGGLSINAGDELKRSPKYKPLRRRLRALDLRFARAAGGHAAEIMGEGRRTSKASPAGRQAIEAALSECQQAAKLRSTGDPADRVRLAEAYARYERELERARAADPAALRYAGDWTGGSTVDVPFELARCEAGIAALRLALDDSPPVEEPAGERVEGCGRRSFALRAAQNGAGRFGPYERAPGAPAYPERIDCREIPARSRLTKELREVARELEARLGGGGVFASDGRTRVESDPDDLRTYRSIALVYYSRRMELAKRPCGEDDPKVVCEASGSRSARSYNELTHFLRRSSVHRKAGRAQRCKEVAKRAFRLADEWKELYADARRTGQWQAGLRYKTRKDGLLDEASLVARFTALGQRADKRSVGTWCTTGAAPAAPPVAAPPGGARAPVAAAPPRRPPPPADDEAEERDP